MLNWSLDAGSESDSFPIDPYVKMAKFTAEISILTDWYKKLFWSLWPISSSMALYVG